MCRLLDKLVAVTLGVICSTGLLAQGQAAGKTNTPSLPLILVQTVALPGITGDFDHFAIDVKGKRLFLAGEDHKTVEVIDLDNNQRVRSLTGFGTPHSILYLPEKDRLYVTDGADGTVKILKGSDYQPVDRIKLVEGADSIGYDHEARQLFVVTGGKDVPLDHSFLSKVDLATDKPISDIRIESNHVEAMVLEHHGSRLFINVTDKNEVAVIDRQAMKVNARWKVGVGSENSPIAFDESGKRLIIVCRKPPMLVVMNSENGSIVTNQPAAARADDVVYDHKNRRIYVPGGEGYISVFSQQDADHYALLAKVPSAPGAKTALLVPELNRLFVAVSPGETNAEAKVLIFEVKD
jgi:DNA-binding beta-propeller fold protein YncE